MILIFGISAYLMFFVTILYAIGFVSELVVPKSINSGEPASLIEALLVNGGLAALFGITHSIMARPYFKELSACIVPRPMERSIFVFIASLQLSLFFWQWRPLPDIIYRIDNVLIAGVITVVSMFGWVMVFWSSFLIDHFDLFGVRQVWLHSQGLPYTHRPFAIRSLYKLVRHPLMLGFLIAFWLTPNMTVGHLLFAILMTSYILIGTSLEERDLVNHFGETYREYQKTTPMLIPFLFKTPK